MFLIKKDKCSSATFSYIIISLSRRLQAALMLYYDLREVLQNIHKKYKYKKYVVAGKRKRSILEGRTQTIKAKMHGKKEVHGVKYSSDAFDGQQTPARAV